MRSTITIDHNRSGWRQVFLSVSVCGYAIFVSNDNADRAGSLAFGHALGIWRQTADLLSHQDLRAAIMSSARRSSFRPPLSWMLLQLQARSLRCDLELAFDCLTNDPIAQDQEYVQPMRKRAAVDDQKRRRSCGCLTYLALDRRVG
jgi:hypothetical protein